MHRHAGDGGCAGNPAAADGSVAGGRVPGLVLALAELPHTRNGKQDSRALESVAKDALSGLDTGRFDDAETDGGAPLDCLLRAIRSVTRKAVTPQTVVEECGIDSLSFLEVQLSMAERGLRFSDDAYHNQDATIDQWAGSMRRIEIDAAVPSPAYITGAQGQDTHRFRADITKVIEHVEAQSPPTVTLHSSLLSIKHIAARDLGIILLQAIERLSASTTVLLPTFTLSYCNGRYYHWRETKSEAGVLGDLVMRELPAIRQNIPPTRWP